MDGDRPGHGQGAVPVRVDSCSSSPSLAACRRIPYAFVMAGRLYTPQRLPGIREVLLRLAFVVVLILGATLIVYFEGGLVDTRSGARPGILDSFYFAVVTITTVGYGDIVPVATHSRLIDALLLAPMRFIFILTVFGTAYQIALRRFHEGYRMKHAVNKLNGHSIICGCGATGRAAIRELLLQGIAPEQIVAVDNDPEALEEGATLGVVTVDGDATREHVLGSIAIDRAASVLVCPSRDDTAVLITLTVRSMNPEARVIAMCQEPENMKLLERSGAHHIVNPALAGGTLMAAATRRHHLAETLTDMLSVGGRLQLDERTARDDEVGRAPGDLAGLSVIRIYRGDRHFDVRDLPEIQAGDVLVYVAPASA